MAFIWDLHRLIRVCPNKCGIGSFGLTVQQPVQIQNAPINVNGNIYFSESTTIISFSIWVTQQSSNFLQASFRQIDNLISEGLTKGEGLENFFKKLSEGEAYLGAKNMFPLIIF